MRTVILDNGHGRETAGKRSPIWDDGSQLFEWEFNRLIVAGIASRLKARRIPYVILVPEENDVLLSERVLRANSIFAKNKGAYLVSVHGNAGGGTGWEVFTSKGETKSDDFATIFAEKAKEMLPNWRMRFDTTDGDPDKEEQFYILRKTLCPALLTENGFMDNEEDCRFMMSEVGQKAIIDAHVASIVEICF